MAKMIKEKEDKQNYVVVTHMNATVDRLIAQESALTEIHFLGFGLTAEDVQNLSYALTENKVLRYLAMDHLNIGDQGADDLSKGLCYNSSLEVVTLRWNKIRDKGAKAIANSLHYNHSLKELVLSFNEIGEDGSKAFALAMKRNNGLETLDLKWNKINDQCGDLLLDSMAENRTLINLYLGGNGTTLRNVGKAQVKTKTKSTKPRRFLSTIMSSGPQSQKITKTVTLDQLRKDTAAKSKSEMALQQAAMAQQQAAPVVQQLPTEIQVGDWVQVKGTGQLRKGKVAYVGQTQFADGTWCGVVFDSPQGKNDGSVAGVRYFTCQPNHGSFLRPEKLVLCNSGNDDDFGGGDAPPPVLREAAGGGGLFDDNDMMMPDDMMMGDDMGGAEPPPNVPDMDGLDDDDFFT